MNFFITNPLEQFEISSLIGINIPLLGYWQFSFTNFGFYAIITSIIVILLLWLGNMENRILINPWSYTTETIYQTIHNMVKVQIGGKLGEYYFPFIFSIFTFILFANLISLIPYSFAITSHMVLALTFSLSILIGVTILGFNLHGIKYFSIIVPQGAPIALLPLLILLEFVSYIAKGISHGLRLAINLLAGHCLMLIICGFIFNFMISGVIQFILSPIGIAVLIAISLLEFGIAFIQAYVFSLLASSYISDSIKLH